jgi:membrane protein
VPDVQDRLAGLRERWPWLDHAVRAYQRYDADGGNRLAGAVTYYGFLSVFPLIVLAFSVLGYVLAGNAEARAEFVAAVRENIPGLIGGRGGIDVDRLIAAKTSAGLIGLAGLVWIGSAWVDVLRESLRTIWHQNVQAGNFAVKKVRDVVVLAGLGVTVALSLAVTAVVTAATSFVLRHIGIEEGIGAKLTARGVGLLLALLTDTLLFAYVYTGLPRLREPLRRVLRGAVLAAVLFEILKVVGTIYVRRTTHNPVYGTVAVAVGLLVWINLGNRILLFCAAWTVTAGGESDLEPSGTASPEAARRAGLPEEFAASQANLPALTVQGAPAPLQAAVQGSPDAYPPASTPPRVPGVRDATPPLGGRRGGPLRVAVGTVLGFWLRRKRG